MLATQRGHKDVVQSLLESKANPNITDKVGLCLHVWIVCSLLIVCTDQWLDGFAHGL